MQHVSPVTLYAVPVVDDLKTTNEFQLPYDWQTHQLCVCVGFAGCIDDVQCVSFVKPASIAL